MDTKLDVLIHSTILQMFLRVLNIEVHCNICVLHFFTKIDTYSTTRTRREKISSVSYYRGSYQYSSNLYVQCYNTVPLLLAPENMHHFRFFWKIPCSNISMQKEGISPPVRCSVITKPASIYIIMCNITQLFSMYIRRCPVTLVVPVIFKFCMVMPFNNYSLLAAVESTATY